MKNREWEKRRPTNDRDADHPVASDRWMPRLSASDFDDVTRVSKDGAMIFGPTVDGEVGPAKYLRPRPGLQEKGNAGLGDYNITVSRECILSMMNSAVFKHAEWEGHCEVPSFRLDRSIPKGVTERWCLSCENCGYNSAPDSFNLYKEIKKEGRGAKKAEPNLGVALGAQETGSQVKARMLFACANASVMAKSSLQKEINAIGCKTIELNEKDMREKRDNLKRVKALRGDNSGVKIEMDGLFNSRTFYIR